MLCVSFVKGFRFDGQAACRAFDYEAESVAEAVLCVPIVHGESSQCGFLFVSVLICLSSSRVFLSFGGSVLGSVQIASTPVVLICEGDVAREKLEALSHRIWTCRLQSGLFGRSNRALRVSWRMFA